MRSVIVIIMIGISSFLFGQQSHTKQYGTSNTNAPAASPAAIQKSALISWTLIDQGRFLSLGRPNIRPLASDPDLNILTYGYQKRINPDFSMQSVVYYSYSTDQGTTWTRISDPVNYPDSDLSTLDNLRATSAWPTSAIFNPTNNLSDAWWYGTWMGDADGEGNYQDAMWAYDTPVMGNSAVNTRKRGGVNYPGTGLTDSTWFYDGGPHYAFTSKTNMFDLYSVMDRPDFMNANKVRRGIARYNGTDSISYYIPATWDSMAWKSFGVCFGGDAIEVGGVKKVAACWAGLYNDYQNWDSTTAAFRIAISYSNDDGATFSAWDTIPLSTMPGLGTKRNIWRYSASDDAENGALLLDSIGNPHVFTVLQSEPYGVSSTSPVIAELYKDTGGVWKGKIIGQLNPYSRFTYGGFNVFGCELSAARSTDGTAFFVSYGNGPSGTTLESDIYVSGRHWTTVNWKNPINLTQSPGSYEVVNHVATIAPNVSGYTYRMCLTYAQNPPGHETEDGNVSTTKFWFGSYDMDVTPLNFDYTWDGFNTVNGRTVTPDTTFDSLQVTIRNNGEQPQFSSFEVRYRILKGNTVLYAESLTMAGLALQESRTITWPGSFQPGDTGTYKIEALIKAGDQIPDNDTLYGWFHVVYPSPMSLSTAQKFASTYTEITGISSGLHDDDASYSIQLPFSFMYDGVVYDSATFSTNGWIELGTIDTTNSVLMLHRRDGDNPNTGGLSNDELAIKATDLRRPGNWYNRDANKVFGAWWDDQSTKPEYAGGDSADISYTTLGSTPNRSFVIQWKNNAARYEDGNRGTRLNYQVRLYEKSNMIEFCYGPMVAGSFAVDVETDPEFGASIGMADTVRGPYHYFDIYKYLSTGYGYGDYNFLEQHLHPVNDWPGPDSSIRLIPGTMQSVHVSLNSRWNLVSNPTCETRAITDLFPGAIPGAKCYEYKSSYRGVDSLVPGRGYWLKFYNTPSVITITGCPLLSICDTLQAGWNLIAGPGHDVPAPAIAGNITASTYGYNGSYVVASTMKPGKAYWIKSSGGILCLGPVAVPKAEPENFDAYSRVTITDKSGLSQILYLREKAENDLDLDRYEMPPAISPDNFDARFSSNRILEAYPAGAQFPAKYPITIQSAEYPLTVSWEIKNNNGKTFKLGVEQNGKLISQNGINGKGEMKLLGNVSSLFILAEGQSELPKEFSLDQNYPNPFNPVTSIHYALPHDAHVTLKVFDILGREVATLVNKNQEAGFKDVDFDAGNFASGVYFYKIEAGTFIAVKKMVVLK